MGFLRLPKQLRMAADIDQNQHKLALFYYICL